MLERPAASLERQALDASIEMAATAGAAPGSASNPWGSWAAQMAAALQATGVQFDPAQRQPLSAQQVEAAAMARHLQRAAEAAVEDSHPRMQHYFGAVRDGSLAEANGYSLTPYLAEVHPLAWRSALARLRTGCHWGVEETMQ
eukprot:scaffold27.g6005.t1